MTSTSAPSQCQTVPLDRLVNPTDKQREFLAAIADKDFVLYGGEGGGGKSYILRWWLVLYLIWCFRTLGLRNVRVGMFAVDYPMLLDRQISKIQTEFPSWLGKLTHDTTWNFELRPEFGGGSLALRNLDKPEKYKSAEFAAIAVEELTEVSLKVFNDLRWRIRWPGIERRKFAAATNPGGVGHSWVKAYWIDKKYPPELEVKRDQFVFVRAKASDNPHLVDGYHDDLLTLPPDMARMVGKGDWNVYTGQYFPQFGNWPDGDPRNQTGPQRHIIPAKEAAKLIKSWWTRTLSGDWGYEHPSCFHWHAKNEQKLIITYRELWDRRVGEVEWGRRITEASRGEKLASFPFSWDAGRLSPRSAPKYPKSIVQLVSDSLGAGVPKPHPADSSPGSRMSGYRLMSQLLDADMWLISDACPKLIECLPTLIRDPDDSETVLKVDYAAGDTIGDDPADSARMGLQNEFGSTVTPIPIIAEKRIAEYAEARNKDVEDLDINTVAQLHRRATVQETRRRNKRRGGLGRIWRPQNN